MVYTGSAKSWIWAVLTNSTCSVFTQHHSGLSIFQYAEHLGLFTPLDMLHLVVWTYKEHFHPSQVFFVCEQSIKDMSRLIVRLAAVERKLNLVKYGKAMLHSILYWLTVCLPCEYMYNEWEKAWKREREGWARFMLAMGVCLRVVAVGVSVWYKVGGVWALRVSYVLVWLCKRQNKM